MYRTALISLILVVFLSSVVSAKEDSSAAFVPFEPETVETCIATAIMKKMRVLPKAKGSIILIKASIKWNGDCWRGRLGRLKAIPTDGVTEQARGSLTQVQFAGLQRQLCSLLQGMPIPVANQIRTGWEDHLKPGYEEPFQIKCTFDRSLTVEAVVLSDADLPSPTPEQAKTE